MTANKPNVQRYDDMGCPEEICRVDTMHESDDGDYVLYEDYEALQAECENLRCIISDLKDWDCDVSGGFLSIPVDLRRRMQEAINAARQEPSHDNYRTQRGRA